MGSAPTDAEPAVILVKAYDHVLWSVQKAEKFPRSFRFSVGERIVQASILAPTTVGPSGTDSGASCRAVGVSTADRLAGTSRHAAVPATGPGRNLASGPIGTDAETRHVRDPGGRRIRQDTLDLDRCRELHDGMCSGRRRMRSR